MQRKVVTKQFTVRSESGKTAELLEYTRQTLYKPLSEPEQWLNGSRSYESRTGDPFNPMPDGSFQHVVTEEIFRSV
jgi:hypothetical protein